MVCFPIARVPTKLHNLIRFHVPAQLVRIGVSEDGVGGIVDDVEGVGFARAAGDGPGGDSKVDGLVAGNVVCLPLDDGEGGTQRKEEDERCEGGHGSWWL